MSGDRHDESLDRYILEPHGVIKTLRRQTATIVRDKGDATEGASGKVIV